MKAFLVLLISTTAFCGASQSADGQHAVSSGVPTSLVALIEEAQLKNPEIQASQHEYRAKTVGANAAGALPDTEIMLQNLSVGSPRPFAGYTNSDFAYVGIGVSQQIPWPGKRDLRSAVARLDAESMGMQSAVVTPHGY